MKGRDHILLSLLSLGVILVPIAGSLPPVWIAAIAVGLGIGALSPDVDTDDAAIFHTNRGRPLSALVPIAGYAIRYLCYYPLALSLRICRGDTDALRHRGLLHTIPGVAASSFFMTGSLAAVMLYFALDLFPLLPLAGSAFTAGALLHLLEDSCTVSGIAWCYPFKVSRYCGTIRTGDAGDLRPKIFEGLFAAGIMGLAIVPSLWPYARDYTPGIGILLLSALWIVILAASGVHQRAGGRADGGKTSYL